MTAEGICKGLILKEGNQDDDNIEPSRKDDVQVNEKLFQSLLSCWKS